MRKREVSGETVVVIPGQGREVASSGCMRHPGCHGFRPDHGIQLPSISKNLKFQARARGARFWGSFWWRVVRRKVRSALRPDNISSLSFAPPSPCQLSPFHYQHLLSASLLLMRLTNSFHSIRADYVSSCLGSSYQMSRTTAWDNGRDIP